MKRPSKELKRIARDILNHRYSVPMGAFVTASLIAAVIEIPFSLSPQTEPATMQLVISLLAEYLILLIVLVLSAGVSKIHLNMTRNLPFRIQDIFSPFREGTERFFCAAFVMSLLIFLCCIPVIAGSLYFYYSGVFTLSVLILAGSILTSAVLCIFLALVYPFVSFLLLDYPQMKVAAAFKESRLMMLKNKGRLLYLLLSFLGWALLILCSLGIAALWVCPYMNQTMTIFYLDCTGELDRIPARDYHSDINGTKDPVY